VPTQHGNPDYQWEVDKKLELGIELSFLPENRINVFVKKCRLR